MSNLLLKARGNRFLRAGAALVCGGAIWALATVAAQVSYVAHSALGYAWLGWVFGGLLLALGAAMFLLSGVLAWLLVFRRAPRPRKLT